MCFMLLQHALLRSSILLRCRIRHILPLRGCLKLENDVVGKEVLLACTTHNKPKNSFLNSFIMLARACMNFFYQPKKKLDYNVLIINHIRNNSKKN